MANEECKMDRVEKKLQKVMYAFIISVMIIVAAFAATIYYYETKELSGGGIGEGLFAKAFVDESVGAAPLVVDFSALLFNFKGDPTYHWDFGDGNTSNEVNPAYNYTEEGEYTCNLTVTDITGKNVTNSVKILVVANKAPTVVSLVSPSSSPRPNGPYWLIQLNKIPIIGEQILASLPKSNSPLTKKEGWIKCEAQALDPEGDEIVLYEWELLQPPAATITGKMEYYTYHFEGENMTELTIPMIYTFRQGAYDLRVTVTDARGNKASSQVRFNVGWSNLELQIATLKGSWNKLWGPNFDFQKPWVKNYLHPLVWKLLGPAHNLSDEMVLKILASVPPETRDSIYNLYYTIVWDKTDKNYHKPNWNPPTIPSDPFPANGAENVSLDANLSWNCSDPDGDGIRYDLYFGKETPLPSVASDQGRATYSFLTSMQPNTTYYWTVRAKDKPNTGGSITVDGPIWSFTTGTV